MKFGILYELQVQKPWSEHSERDVYHNALEQVELADRLGFDYVWAVEHHFLAEYSHSSAPEVFLAAASQRTERIRLGQGVALLPHPFNHPIRVAERASALDILSDGRLDLGTGRSVTKLELAGFGVDPADSRAMWEEAIQVIPQAWTKDNFSWNGDYLAVPPRNVVPKPLQKPHPPLWVACTQPETFQIAGRLGLGALAFGFFAPSYLQTALSRYREAIATAEPVGQCVNNQFATTTLAVCAPSEEEAMEIGTPAAEFFADSVSLLFTDWGKSQDVPKSYRYYSILSHLVTRKGEEQVGPPNDSRQYLCIGDPEHCRNVVSYYSDSGVDQLIFLVQVGRIPHEKSLQTIHLLAEEVLPEFR